MKMLLSQVVILIHFPQTNRVIPCATDSQSDCFRKTPVSWGL